MKEKLIKIEIVGLDKLFGLIETKDIVIRNKDDEIEDRRKESMLANQFMVYLNRKFGKKKMEELYTEFREELRWKRVIFQLIVYSDC